MTVGAAIERWFTPEFRAQNPDIIERQIQRVLGNDPGGYAAAYRVFAESDPIDDLSKIRCPTLVMTGEHDPRSTPTMAMAIHERIAGSRLVILPRYRHSLLIEATAEVVGELRAFLDERRSASSGVGLTLRRPLPVVLKWPIHLVDRQGVATFGPSSRRDPQEQAEPDAIQSEPCGSISAIGTGLQMASDRQSIRSL